MTAVPAARLPPSGAQSQGRTPGLVGGASALSGSLPASLACDREQRLSRAPGPGPARPELGYK